MADVTKDITKRMNYFDRQFLRAKDLRDEQDYHIDRRWRHNRLLHKPGVGGMNDLKVSKVSPKTVIVSKGTAIDNLGREMVLAVDSLPIPVPSGITSSNVDIVIYYSETSTDNSTDPGISGPTRIEESPNLKAVQEGQPYPANAVPLARVPVDGNGEFGTPIYAGVRMEAGISLISLDLTNLVVQNLTVKDPNRDSSNWPMFSCDDSKEVTLNGKLKCDGSEITLVEKLNGIFVWGKVTINSINGASSKIHITSKSGLNRLILARGWATTIQQNSPIFPQPGNIGKFTNTNQVWIINQSTTTSATITIFENTEGIIRLIVDLELSGGGIKMIIKTGQGTGTGTMKDIGYSFQLSWQE